MRLDELCSVIRLNRRTIDHSSSRRIMRVCVCVYKDGTQTNNPIKQDLDTKASLKIINLLAHLNDKFLIHFNNRVSIFIVTFRA